MTLTYSSKKQNIFFVLFVSKLSCQIIVQFVICFWFSQSESDDISQPCVWFLVLPLDIRPRYFTLFLSVSSILTSYKSSGCAMSRFRFCQMNTATFSVVLGCQQISIYQLLLHKIGVKIIHFHHQFEEIDIFVKILMVHRFHNGLVHVLLQFGDVHYHSSLSIDCTTNRHMN